MGGRGLAGQAATCDVHVVYICEENKHVRNLRLPNVHHLIGMQQRAHCGYRRQCSRANTATLLTYGEGCVGEGLGKRGEGDGFAGDLWQVCVVVVCFISHEPRVLDKHTYGLGGLGDGDGGSGDLCFQGGTTRVMLQWCMYTCTHAICNNALLPQQNKKGHGNSSQTYGEGSGRGTTVMLWTWGYT